MDADASPWFVEALRGDSDRGGPIPAGDGAYGPVHRWRGGDLHRFAGTTGIAMLRHDGRNGSRTLTLVSGDDASVGLSRAMTTDMRPSLRMLGAMIGGTRFEDALIRDDRERAARRIRLMLGAIVGSIVEAHGGYGAATVDWTDGRPGFSLGSEDAAVRGFPTPSEEIVDLMTGTGPVHALRGCVWGSGMTLLGEAPGDGRDLGSCRLTTAWSVDHEPGDPASTMRRIAEGRRAAALLGLSDPPVRMP